MRIAGLGGWEWIIVLVIVLLLFGVGRINKIFGELGSGIRSFRDGLSGQKDDEDEKSDVKEEKKDDSETK
ncbi:MAG TPA: twin-arginine translocase TatA/TatE family subunit [Bellilinea sp.]|jgi:sec-independent protein translocase protein TatA|nr:twin-arginine translocase TatA/TatE family subunit [Bellilinea sp.]